MTGAFFARGAACMRARGSFSVALAGGGTPRAFYALLGRSQAPLEFRWERVQFLFGDEGRDAGVVAAHVDPARDQCRAFRVDHALFEAPAA
jgi:hypothetical protein